jgi:hypothetical protein
MDQRRVREPKRGRRIGASSTQSGRHRNPLLDLDRPVRLGSGGFSKREQRSPDE